MTDSSNGRLKNLSEHLEDNKDMKIDLHQEFCRHVTRLQSEAQGNLSITLRFKVIERFKNPSDKVEFGGSGDFTSCRVVN
jgi:hypothetical protein